MKAIYLILPLLFVSGLAHSQQSPEVTAERVIQIQTGEQWWGGVVNAGTKMPFRAGYSCDLEGDLQGNQGQPLLLSNLGRVIWSEAPFAFSISDNEITINPTGELQVSESKGSLKNAFVFASQNYFPSSGKMPDRLLFEQPQYNTWIELIYDQNQEDILKYAHAIIDNGFPPGVLMIDDNWQEAYGNWRFHPEKFPSPKKMMEELHGLGFKVMLWVCPFVSPDTEVFRSGVKDGIFMKNPKNQAIAGSPSAYFNDVAMVGWWNGYSGLLDLSNPKAATWFKGELQYLIDEYDVDGFKLDAGDADFYPDWLVSHDKQITANTHTELFAKIGLDFPLNEYRATWKMAGQPLAQRLRDKGHNWEDLQTLIPNITVQGLMGYAFTCPDMIGGGEFNSFINSTTIDQELIVRSAQVHALMPMMQFSVAPWRILDQEHLAAVKDAVALRKKFTPEILRLTENAAKTGIPIVRTMEFVFPNEGFASIKDQFMLGDDLLVAPVLSKKQTFRTVTLPPGKWKGSNGEIYDGSCTIKVSVGLNTIPFFKRH